jgi:hypothetical protein
MANKQLESTEIYIEAMELVTPSATIPIEDKCVVFNLYENMFHDSITADMMVNDSINLPQKAPLLGEEYLNLILSNRSTSGEETSVIPGDLYVTSISDRYLTKDRQQVYMLHFTSEASIVNANTTISESFRGKKISEIVNTILEDYIDPEENGNDFVVEETEGVENIVIPNWKPFKALNWLAKRAVNKSGVPNFLFFESSGITYFKSVDTLMQEKPIQEFVFSPVVSKNEVLNKLLEGRTHCTDLEINNQFNTVRNTNNGYYASKLITHDIVKKEIKQHTYGLNMAYASFITHTDTYMPLSPQDTRFTVQDRNSFAPDGLVGKTGEKLQSYYDGNIMFHSKHDRMYSKSKSDDYDNTVEEWKLRRNALILGLDQLKLTLTFPGLSYLRVGQMIDLVVPSPEKVIEQNPGMVANKEALVDKFLTGKYLIVAIKHSVNMADHQKYDYTMMVDVIKDALPTVPAHYDGSTKEENN